MPNTFTSVRSSTAPQSASPISRPSDRLPRGIYSLFIALISAPIFVAFQETASDNITHTAVAAALWAGDAEWPPNFLYFYILGFFGWLIDDTTQLRLSTTILLSFAVGLKALLTTEIFRALAPRIGVAANLAAATVLLFSFAIPGTFLLGLNIAYYLGNVTPNVWHNSTTIFLMPFAVAAFMLQARDLEAGTTRHVPTISTLVVVGLLVKPSFFFAYAPATTLLILSRFRSIDKPLLAFIPIVLGGALTVAIYIALYHFHQWSFFQEKSGIAVDPLAVWGYFVPVRHIPAALVFSLLAPLLYVASGLRPARSAWMIYAALLMAAGLILFALFSETGPRQIHGNVSWQTIVCAYLLHAVVIGDLLRKWTKGQGDWRVVGCATVYLAMFVAGLAYLYRIIVLGAPLPY